MHIDDITLSDLEVLGTRSTGPGMFALLDHTETTVGQRALRRRLTSPLTRPSEIADMQAALRSLGTSDGTLGVDEPSVVAVQAYLESNMQPVAQSGVAARAISSWIRVRYPDHLRDMQEGRTATRVLFGRIARICTRYDSESRVLSDLTRRLSEIAKEVLGACNTGSAVEIDRTLRRELAERISEGIELVGELDALNAMSIASRMKGWTTPEIVESPAFLLEAEEAFHPFVENPVPNPVRLDGGEPLVFLTGPNMAGKTTYLRTVGLLMLLAQTGMNVPAASMRFAPVDAILTSLNPVDNLRAGVSYFLAEVHRVRDAARLLSSGRRCLVLFDEVFKGTNVQDALEASRQVIEGFAQSSTSGSIFSSHLTDLATTFRNHPSIRLRRFDAEIVDGEPSFSYALEPGISEKRMGLLLLDQAGVPELLRAIRA